MPSESPVVVPKGKGLGGFGLGERLGDERVGGVRVGGKAWGWFFWVGFCVGFCVDFWNVSGFFEDYGSTFSGAFEFSSVGSACESLCRAWLLFFFKFC